LEIVHDLKVLLQQYEQEDSFKEKIITQLRETCSNQDELIKILKTEVRQSGNSINTLGIAITKGIASDTLNLSMDEIAGDTASISSNGLNTSQTYNTEETLAFQRNL